MSTEGAGLRGQVNRLQNLDEVGRPASAGVVTPTPVDSVTTGPDGVQIINTAGWGLAIPWPDAVRLAHTVLAGAYARRLLVERDKICARCRVGDHNWEDLVEDEPRSCTCPCACVDREYDF